MEQKIDYKKVFATAWRKRKLYFISLPIAFVLSCLIILPEPRYYTCEVELAPENGGTALGGLAGLASSVGINIGDNESSDAIYPTLYPELFNSPEFTVSLFNLKVSTYDGEVSTDYYTYLKKYQKKNWLFGPLIDWMHTMTEKYSMDETSPAKTNSKQIDPFDLSKKDFKLLEKIQKNIVCNVDKKTEVITISVTDQDRKVCALLADSLKNRLQTFIIDYRTKKARQDVQYFQHLTDSTKIVYDAAVRAVGAFNDSHRNVVEQTYVEEGDRLKNDMELKLNTYNTFAAQLSAAKAKVQERTPSFTTLKSATIPQKPAGPKRMIFIGAMLFLTFLGTTFYVLKEILKD